MITHESASQQNVHYDLEPFDNRSFGYHLMDELAALMNEEGEYAVFVEFLTSKSHNEWIDAAIARQQERYPRMRLVTDRLETYAISPLPITKQKNFSKRTQISKALSGAADTIRLAQVWRLMNLGCRIARSSWAQV